MARVGLSRCPLTHAKLVAGACALGLAQPVSAHRVSIAATSLDFAITALARQTGTDIASLEPGLRAVATRALAGDLSVRGALSRLLAGTGYHAVAVPDGYRIVRDVVLQRRRVVPAAHPLPPIRVDDPEQIVVTATKQPITLLRFPGSIKVVTDFDAIDFSAAPVALDAVARDMPVLQRTDLGPGRNKIFVRGIADSSFLGPTQSTLTTYFGDVPLGFTGRDPALQLVDVDRVEVLEGPQGTLYGAGAIGGVIRVTPRAVDLKKLEGRLALGGTATIHGSPGYDASVVSNVPLIDDTLGVRAVGYRSVQGGYIGDPSRKLSDINRVDTTGGHLALKLATGDGWTVDTSVAAQHISADDGQYNVLNVGKLGRRTAIAEPYGSSVLLARIVIDKQWDNGLHLTSATGIVQLDAFDRFDATALIATAVPTAYQVDTVDRLITHETRVSHTAHTGTSWVLGIAALFDRDAQNRTLGGVNAPLEIIGVTNSTRSIAAFGEGTAPLTPRLALTVGARATTARIDGEPSATPRSAAFVKGQSTLRLDPTIAASWQLGGDVAAFARLQSGYRTGGLAVARGVGRVADFASDSILVGEVGVRKEGGRTSKFTGSSTLSYARWSNIQADLFSRSGQPFTANIGSADVLAVEANLAWRPMRGLTTDFAMLYTYNRVYGPIADSSVKANRRLPETPPFAANSSISYRWRTAGGTSYGVTARGRYVGRSVLGTGDFLDVSQGDYASFDLIGGWTSGKYSATLAVENLADAGANVFALGNPLTLNARNQATPLRPRSVRLGFAVSL